MFSTRDVFGWTKSPSRFCFEGATNSLAFNLVHDYVRLIRSISLKDRSNKLIDTIFVRLTKLSAVHFTVLIFHFNQIDIGVSHRRTVHRAKARQPRMSLFLLFQNNKSHNRVDNYFVFTVLLHPSNKMTRTKRVDFLGNGQQTPPKKSSFAVLISGFVEDFFLGNVFHWHRVFWLVGFTIRRSSESP